VPFPVKDPETGRTLGYRHVMSDLDENTLREIAATTGGRYFRADDRRTIESAYAAIDAAKKIEFQAKSMEAQSMTDPASPSRFIGVTCFGCSSFPAAAMIAELTRRVRTCRNGPPQNRARGSGARTTDARDPWHHRPHGHSVARVRWRLWLGLGAQWLSHSRVHSGERWRSRCLIRRGEILIAVDLSRSMLAPDVALLRGLERAKLLITSLLERLEG
jgi:hypothetical protein